LKKIGVVSEFIKKSMAYGFGIFWYISELFLNRKVMDQPRLALGPWWTHDHGAVQPLQGSGGHHDSSERERE
jgi:hypothetical protein